MTIILSTPNELNYVGNRVDAVTRLWQELMEKAYPVYGCVIVPLPLSWLDDEDLDPVVRQKLQQDKEQLFQRFTRRRWLVVPVETGTSLPFYFLMEAGRKKVLCPLRTPYWNLSPAQAQALAYDLGSATLGYVSRLVYGGEALAVRKAGVT